MNPTLFTAFLLITAVLIVAPGPIVTLVISTGATQGVRAALTTVAGTTVGNVLLLASIAIGLNWVVAHAGLLFEALRWVGAAYLVWLGIQAWRNAGRSGEDAEGHRPATVLARSDRRAVQSENHRVLHRLPAPIPRSRLARRTAACGDVRGVRIDGRNHRFGLGGRRRSRARLADETGARQAARTDQRRRSGGRRPLALARPSTRLRFARLAWKARLVWKESKIRRLSGRRPAFTRGRAPSAGANAARTLPPPRGIARRRTEWRTPQRFKTLTSESP